ncbi:hypothetical protein [Enterococcus sp. CSURQ0835]|uniref:hypothetical protein n=1 Tax=Enterococcus sp. CSURQ0835 TaxID=2681394 RepID=UPI00135A6DAA|nr:hypothetical protein [Enterococcus sp. CSURQ0835]
MRKLKPQNTYRHLLNFVGKASVRPILAGVHITKEGDLEATDSHILLRLLNRFSAGDDRVLELKEMRLIEGTYPDTSRLVPASFESSLQFDSGEAVNVVKFLKALDKASVVQLTAKEDKLRIEDIQTGANETFNLLWQSGGSVDMNIQAKYLQPMMAFIADCIAQPVEIGYTSSVRPLVFKVENNFVGLITPVRKK